jgi:HEAT repeat protein
MLKVDPNSPPPQTSAVPEAKVATNPALAILSDMLFDRDRDIRLAAALALGQLREKSTQSVLNLALRDAENVVREAAQSALAALN